MAGCFGRTKRQEFCTVQEHGLWLSGGMAHPANLLRTLPCTKPGIHGAQHHQSLGTNHTDWQDNLSFATKLQVQLEKQVPGICRPISVRAQRYNQDLCPAAVLVEVGAAGNDRQEALLAAEYLANAIISLACGAQSS